MSNSLEELEAKGLVVPPEVRDMLLKMSRLQVAGVLTDAEVALLIDALAALATEKAMKLAGKDGG